MKLASRVILAACLCAFLPIHAAIAQEIKLGYIDTVKIFAEFKETIEAEELYKKEVEAWKKEAAEMETELANLREEIQSQSLMLSEEKLAEKKLVFEQRLKEYQTYMTDVFGEGGQAERRNRELTQPIVERINSVIAEMAEAQGYDVILDSAQGNIIYAKKELDLTEFVLEKLRTELE